MKNHQVHALLEKGNTVQNFIGFCARLYQVYFKCGNFKERQIVVREDNLILGSLSMLALLSTDSDMYFSGGLVTGICT